MASLLEAVAQPQIACTWAFVRIDGSWRSRYLTLRYKLLTHSETAQCDASEHVFVALDNAAIQPVPLSPSSMVAASLIIKTEAAQECAIGFPDTALWQEWLTFLALAIAEDHPSHDSSPPVNRLDLLNVGGPMESRLAQLEAELRAERARRTETQDRIADLLLEQLAYERQARERERAELREEVSKLLPRVSRITSPRPRNRTEDPLLINVLQQLQGFTHAFNGPGVPPSAAVGSLAELHLSEERPVTSKAETTRRNREKLSEMRQAAADLQRSNTRKSPKLTQQSLAQNRPNDVLEADSPFVGFPAMPYQEFSMHRASCKSTGQATNISSDHMPSTPTSRQTVWSRASTPPPSPGRRASGPLPLRRNLSKDSRKPKTSPSPIAWTDNGVCSVLSCMPYELIGASNTSEKNLQVNRHLANSCAGPRTASQNVRRSDGWNPRKQN
eukprot:TRINITY_DN4496_c0_g1_i1.p1 TRINITY_DN4496_c0_g1~~TRINITY_DN4496_c0_g1_i1.p1  ORF type:complete len:444 (-),score=30.05 TRINITY_DN4496_c0_g1_i1:103-1434(-)